MPSDRRLRLLLLAELANPNWISVPTVGWKQVEALHAVADVHLVTHPRNKENILAAGFPADRVTFIGSPRAGQLMQQLAMKAGGARAMGGFTETAFSLPLYYWFEREAWRIFGKRIEGKEFDVVHRVTPVSPAIPSPMATWCRSAGVPFVLGPVNGGVPWPKGYEAQRAREGEWLSYFREAHKLLPYHRASRNDASALVAGSAVVWRAMEAWADHRFYIPENAIDPRQFARVQARPEAGPLKLAFVGRLIAFKGAELLVRAAAPLLRDGRAVLDVIGDGPDMSLLKALAAELKVAHAVRLDGWVAHADLPERLAQSTVFAFPSIREFGGAVVMEAMMLGLIPVVVDYGGPAELVTEETGFRVPVASRDRVIEQFAQVLERLAGEPIEAVAERGHRARERALQEFSIEARLRKTLRIYDWVLGGKERPDLRPSEHAVALYG